MINDKQVLKYDTITDYFKTSKLHFIGIISIIILILKELQV